MFTQRQFTVRAGDGVTLDAFAQGPADRTPLLLLHGFTDSRRSFGPLLAALPETVHAVAFSLRGHGDSRKPADPSAYRASCFADDVIAVLDAVGHPGCVLLGHSMGAWAALHCVLRHPARIDGLVLIGAFANFTANPAVMALRQDVMALRDPVDPAFVRAFQEAASSAYLPASFLDMVVEESLRVPARIWRSSVAAFLNEDVPNDLSAIKVPTRLVWGELDPFVPRKDQDSLLDRIGGSTLHVCTGLGHSPHWDRPDLVARIPAEFTFHPQLAA